MDKLIEAWRAVLEQWRTLRVSIDKTLTEISEWQKGMNGWAQAWNEALTTQQPHRINNN